jgi:hypothetical protein
MLALKGGNSVLRRRAEASPLLALLRKPHRFHSGDEISNLTGGGVSAAKLIKIGLMLGMTGMTPDSFYSASMLDRLSQTGLTIHPLSVLQQFLCQASHLWVALLGQC